MTKTAIIIPARYASSRLQAKALIEIADKPIIQWVWEKAKCVKDAQDVIIATDNKEIYDRAKSFGANVEMTSVEHRSGSDRICEVAKRHEEFDYIVNLQGDEPLIKPESIDLIIETLKADNADISTLLHIIEDENQINDPNQVKCVIDKNNYALYFSRSVIPYPRNEGKCPVYGHIGIYGYKREALLKLTSYQSAKIEESESLEQLRALYNGMKIKTAIVDYQPVGIDTLEDLNRFKKAVLK